MTKYRVLSILGTNVYKAFFRVNINAIIKTVSRRKLSSIYKLPMAIKVYETS